ncbi:MAG: hypothetical protein Q9164_000781 [Protoblastenia rupestris]
MPLVVYSDSDSSDREESMRHGQEKLKTVSKKRKRSPVPAEPSLPPLPDSFHDSYASTSRISNQDDPALHAGRQRQIPHVEEQSKKLQDVINRVPSLKDDEEARLHSLVKSDLDAQLPLHISLSRPIVLRTDQRQPFVEDLSSKIKEAGVQP